MNQHKPQSIFEAAHHVLNEATYHKIPAEAKFRKSPQLLNAEINETKFANDIRNLSKKTGDWIGSKFMEGNLSFSIPTKNIGLYAQLYSLYAVYFLISKGAKLITQLTIS